MNRGGVGTAPGPGPGGSDELEQYGHLEAWARELGISEKILAERLAGVNPVPGRTIDGEVRGFCAESDVGRICAEIAGRGGPEGPQSSGGMSGGG